MTFDFPDGWHLQSVEDSMKAIIDYRGKTPRKTPSGVPLITAKIVKEVRIMPPTEFIASEGYDSWMNRGLPENKLEGHVKLQKRASEIARKYTELIQPIVKRIIENIHESHTLSQIRDTLLPRLLSGEIRVDDAAWILEGT